MEEHSTSKGSRKQVHLSSAVGSLQRLTVTALHLTPGWPDGVTESRWDSEVDKHPTLYQLPMFILLLFIHRLEPQVTKHPQIVFPC